MHIQVPVQEDFSIQYMRISYIRILYIRIEVKLCKNKLLLTLEIKFFFSSWPVATVVSVPEVGQGHCCECTVGSPRVGEGALSTHRVSHKV